MDKKIYIVLGAPGSGKGTRSELIQNTLGIPHISTGAIIRENREDIVSDTSSNYNIGKLMPDGFVGELLKKELNKLDTSKGYILDGYPRNIEQVEKLDEILSDRGEKITKVFSFEASLDTIYSRILGRKTCKKCSKIFRPSDRVSVGDKCPDCGGMIDLRTDDNAETLKNRIDTFFVEIKPIQEHYASEGLLEIVDANENPEHILNRI